MPHNADVRPAALYQLPEQFRELAEGAAKAGLARSAEEFWIHTARTSAHRPRDGATALELIIAGIIRAHPAGPNESRKVEQRFRDAMSALLGERYRYLENDRNDRALLAEMAWALQVDKDRASTREAARRALEAARGKDAVTESDVRRLIRKHEQHPQAAASFDSSPDSLRLMLAHQVVSALADLLRSVGTQVDIPDVPTGHLDLSMEK